MDVICPVCNWHSSKLFAEVEQYSYYQCESCNVIFISPEILANIDNGNFLITYDEFYWKEELYAAKERSWGTSLARIAELFLYARLPIRKFIDIGSGPGYLLDAIQYYFPSSQEIFYATELFPPAA